MVRILPRYKGYGIFHVVYIIINVLITRIFFINARIIRLPFYFRIQGKLEGLNKFTSGRSLRIDVKHNASLYIGDNVQLNDNCQISCCEKVVINDNVLIASKVFITDHDHFFSHDQGPSMDKLVSCPVYIGENTWIGNGVSILKGVSIGSGSIIAAGSVVTKSFPPGSILGGIPAKHIASHSFTEETVNKMDIKHGI